VKWGKIAARRGWQRHLETPQKRADRSISGGTAGGGMSFRHCYSHAGGVDQCDNCRSGTGSDRGWAAPTGRLTLEMRAVGGKRAEFLRYNPEKNRRGGGTKSIDQRKNTTTPLKKKKISSEKQGGQGETVVDQPNYTTRRRGREGGLLGFWTAGGLKLFQRGKRVTYSRRERENWRGGAEIPGCEILQRDQKKTKVRAVLFHSGQKYCKVKEWIENKVGTYHLPER